MCLELHRHHLVTLLFSDDETRRLVTWDLVWQRDQKHICLFTSKIFCKIGIVAFSFVFDKYCSIMD